jgi:hypothetical protein
LAPDALAPLSAKRYQNRGVAYEKKGEKAKAEEEFAQAKKLGGKGRSVFRSFNPEPTATARNRGKIAVAVGSGLNEFAPY